MSAPPQPVPRPAVLPQCDRCSARSYFEVVTGSGPLYFCGHHFGKKVAPFIQGRNYLVTNLFEHP